MPGENVVARDTEVAFVEAPLVVLAVALAAVGEAHGAYPYRYWPLRVALVRAAAAAVETAVAKEDPGTTDGPSEEYYRYWSRYQKLR